MHPRKFENLWSQQQEREQRLLSNAAGLPRLPADSLNLKARTLRTALITDSNKLTLTTEKICEKFSFLPLQSRKLISTHFCKSLKRYFHVHIFVTDICRCKLITSMVNFCSNKWSSKKFLYGDIQNVHKSKIFTGKMGVTVMGFVAHWAWSLYPVLQVIFFPLKILNHGLFGRMKIIASRLNLEPTSKEQL